MLTAINEEEGTSYDRERMGGSLASTANAFVDKPVDAVFLLQA